MMAGRLKYRLEIYRLDKSVNDFGESEESYTLTNTIHAERVKATGRRSEEVGEHFPDYRAEFNIRDSHPVQENWRVQQVGGYLYTVTNIIPNLDRGYKTLICDRVNE